MKRSKYDDNFKEEILNECREVGNASMVARRHDISRDTVYGWIKASKKRGSVSPLPRKKDSRLKEVENRMKSISTENDRLKKIVADKELELSILRELRSKSNPI
jgi:transposase-like protein